MPAKSTLALLLLTAMAASGQAAGEEPRAVKHPVLEHDVDPNAAAGHERAVRRVMAMSEEEMLELVPAKAVPQGGNGHQELGPARKLAVFASGREGYHTFRIPAIVVSGKGTLLAFCEGRRKSGSDSGDIDTVLKRSFDGGKTWGPLQLVWDDGPHTCGNSCPVVDRDTGTIWLHLTRNDGRDHQKAIDAGTSREPRTAWITSTTDDGATWRKPVNISPAVRKPDWRWYGTGPS
ncbi:MAG: exo-alpha-sialidase, partial [Planctomycetes bacterium]|nr:exo-alpha-sialidase [Planctomycetota bacterium]